jgi:CRP/FNR family transcriptional regulator, cyclic AMP receptor protein
VTLPLLEVLGPELREQFRALARHRKFAKGEIVFHQGDTGDVLHLVERGRFAVQVLTPNGDSMVIRIVGAGEHFGELAVASDEPTRNATLFALEASSTLAIHRRDFDELRKTEPGVDRLLVAALVQRVRAETETALELAFVSADVRIYRRLVSLAGVYGEGVSGGPTVLPITQEMIAGLAGSTRATVNRAVRALEQAGIVELRRSVVSIVDLVGLKKAADL